jgi:Fungal specific transcription factor domain
VLLRSVLSCAAEHTRSLGLCPAQLAVDLHDRAIRAIRLELAGWSPRAPVPHSSLPISIGMTADEALLAAVLLQPGAIAFSGSAPLSVHTHLEIGFHMLTDLGYLKNPEIVNSFIPKFLLQRFAIVDLGICVWHRRRPRIAPDTWLIESINISRTTVENAFEDIQPSFYEMVGCPYTVYRFLNRVMHLASDVSCLSSPQTQRNNYQEAISLETEIRTYDLTLHDFPDNASVPNASMDAIFRAFTHAALILLFRRVFLEPSSSPRVQNSIETILALIDTIPMTPKNASAGAEDVHSGVDSATGLPFYLAAREAITTEIQDAIRQKHAEWREVYPNPARIQLMDVAEKLWLQRSKDPGLSEEACQEIEASCDAYLF